MMLTILDFTLFSPFPLGKIDSHCDALKTNNGAIKQLNESPSEQRRPSEGHIYRNLGLIRWKTFLNPGNDDSH